MAYFPMMVNIENKKVLVVGGGEEGRKKVEILSRFDADITLITPDPSGVDEEKVGRLKAREFRDSDIDDEDYVMIVAATSDRALNERISGLAADRKIPVNVVDDVELCSFIFPVIMKENDVVCSVSSGGKSPYVAQHVMRLIRGVVPPDIGEINDKMGVFRKQAKEEIGDTAERRRFLRNKLDELLGGVVS